MSGDDSVADESADGPEREGAAPGEESEDPGSAAAQLRAELEQSQNRYRRALADLDNYRKRTEREAQRQAAAAGTRMLRDWLDAVDSVERALKMEPGDPGLTAVLEQMNAILTRNGVSRIETADARFDPERHEAVAVVDGDDQMIVDVARSGYVRSDGEVVRPAQVVVGRRKVD
ncbi:nucleotide exchange factor GrpE [Tsukamurella sp. 8F]|uniref:nucleotide exchange factor GrpE n=1 Tax=unclassified Tsukamurella TaxID=2633480 RepID=UPI0023B8DCF2|nr:MULTISPECIES: nucleotide exchange factor GrpE [unclassified Tsukamurella]MDF0528595.1 nucleotide exchange factor GrpE [Tsukamurella sp. 8J]MDF0585557.1 nucleotide exchange factor GrpE [Tsukamurella sp. 8F]